MYQNAKHLSGNENCDIKIPTMFVIVVIVYNSALDCKGYA